MQKDQRLEARNGDPQIGLDRQSPLEELVVLGPRRRHELLCHLRAEMLDNLSLVLQLRTDSTMVEVAEGAKCEDKINTANVPRIVRGCCSIIVLV